MHICRGYGADAWAASGGYDASAAEVFPRLGLDPLLLEYDMARSIPRVSHFSRMSSAGCTSARRVAILPSFDSKQSSDGSPIFDLPLRRAGPCRARLRTICRYS